MRAALYLLCGALACAAPNQKKTTEISNTLEATTLTAQQDNQDWLGFPPYPNARTLCVEHVSAQKMHVLWRSYASQDPPQKVISFYDATSTAQTLRISGDKETTLTVFPASLAEKYPSCSETTTEKELTVILVSQAIRP